MALNTISLTQYAMKSGFAALEGITSDEESLDNMLHQPGNIVLVCLINNNVQQRDIIHYKLQN